MRHLRSGGKGSVMDTERHIKAFNRWYDKRMSLITPGALLLGFLCSTALYPSVPLVPYLFAYISFTMGLGIRAAEVKAAFTRPGPLLAALAAAHLVMPAAAYALGALLFGADSPYVVGMVLFALIPLGISSIIWAVSAGGSAAAITAAVVVSSLLSPLVVPLGIEAIFGTTVEVDTARIMTDLLLIVVVPTAAGILLNEGTRGKASARMQPAAGLLSKLAFMTVIMLNAASIGPQVHKLGSSLPALIPAVVVLVGLGYAFGFAAALPWRSGSIEATLSYGAGIRNISLGIVIGLGYFSPEAALPVVLSILIQQPAAALHRHLLHKLHNRRTGQRASGEVR